MRPQQGARCRDPRPRRVLFWMWIAITLTHIGCDASKGVCDDLARCDVVCPSGGECSPVLDAGFDPDATVDAGHDGGVTDAGPHGRRPQELLPSNTTTGASFGWSVAVHGDVMVVGAPGDSSKGNNAGAAYVFRAQDGTWEEEQKLFARDGDLTSDETEFAEFGSSVAISGETIVIGARSDLETDVFAGAAHVFRFDRGAWLEETKLRPSDGSRLDYFGTSVAIDGDTILIGAPEVDSDETSSRNIGAAYIFQRTEGQWR